MAATSAAMTPKGSAETRPYGSHCCLLIAAVLMLAGGNQAAAQCVAPGPCIINATTTNTTSTTHHETDIPGGSAGVIVPGNGPLQAMLGQVLAGPNGATVLNALNNLGALGPKGPSSKQSLGTNTSITNTVAIGPQTILFGPDLTLSSFFVPAGHTNINTNTHFESFFEVSPGSQTISARGINWLSGDLYTTLQTAILDGDFNFVDGLLGRARNAGADAGAFSPMSMAYAEVSLGADGVIRTGDDEPASGVLAYAGRRERAANPIFPRTVPPAPDTGVWSLWAKGQYGSASFAGTGANFGFGYKSRGGEFGVDYLRGDWLMGGALGFGRSEVAQDLTGDNAGISTVRLGAYASFRPGPWSFTGVLAGGFHSIAADRLVMLPVATASMYDATTFNAAAEAARRYGLWGGTIQPMAGLVYTNLHTDGFAEGGTPFLNIAGNSADIGSLKGYVGARAWRTYEVLPGWLVTPEVRARVLYDFLNDSRAYTAHFLADPAATPFAVTGLQPDRTAGLFGASLSLRLAPQWRAFATYDAELRGGDVAHLVSGGVRGSW
jgi:uncharacterized protein with beta-barrel porin domain